ncbi:MarR family winged helix-turn-helix transcriptional regulator [Streptacidiphilus sp. P02-A3a]|uniref:MarR family winged helix-turn-helix transcriptional regulator n=1 Tax=Streptacidiphilus sp. P02-A3a TaxID=2704468 RepID=UPI0015FA1E92|nr:MarR family winged helix-turn-helix transcriptional regulator [Streptacidiphilus sp. P02-A3a]QMU69489.1 winged helix-turn-helix transcriptional regulator [Streptacidiphilus sp. P02-A3a]
MDDDEVRGFRTQMKLLQQRLRQEALPVQGITRTALQVLAALVRLPEGSQPGQVAQELRMTSSNVAAALRELEAAGYLRRRRDEADARRVLVFVTEPGRALLADVRGERDTWLGRATAALLDQDEQRLLLAAGALMQRLAEFEQTAPGEPG